MFLECLKDSACFYAIKEAHSLSEVFSKEAQYAEKEREG